LTYSPLDDHDLRAVARAPSGSRLLLGCRPESEDHYV